MEVLESIGRYIDYIQDNHAAGQDKADILGILYSYCSSIDNQMDVLDIKWDFFHRFITYWLPKSQVRFEERELYQLLNKVIGYFIYLDEVCNIKAIPKEKEVRDYKNECLRINRLKRSFFNFICDPIISFQPLVIDFNIYRKYKSRKQGKKNWGIYKQGLFQVIKVDYDSTVVIRKLPQGDQICLILINPMIKYIKAGDILHIRIRQKEYFLYWELIDFKNCYLSDAIEYLNY